MEYLVNILEFNKSKYGLTERNSLSFELEKLFCGVPQRSVFGSLFFLIFINDPSKNIKSKLYLSADDTTALSNEKITPQNNTETIETLKSLTDWFHVNGLKLNLSKFKYMVFRTSRNRTVSN